MRLTNKILLLLISSFALLLHGCIKEEWNSSGGYQSGLATLTVDVVSGGVSSRSSNISTLHEDYTINTLRIFAMDTSGAIETNKYVDEVTMSGEDGVFCSFEVIQSPEKLLYVVVNEPRVLSARLDSVRRLSELANLNYEIAEALNNEAFISGEALGETNKLIPMSAKVKVDASGDCMIKVNVDRVVARVDLMVDKDNEAYSNDVKFDSSTSISVNGLYYKTSLFETPYLPTPTAAELRSINGVKLSKTTFLDLEEESRGSSKRLLSFYIAERTYNIDEDNPSENRLSINIDNITVDNSIKNINSTILLGNNVQPYIEQINRNYVYKIYATYKGEKESLEVSGEYVIKDWTVEELDGNIEGVMLAVTNQVVMDWTRLNNSFSAKDIAFGSNRNIDIYVPSSYDIDTQEFQFKRCKFVAQEGVTYNLKDLSLYGVPDGENYLCSVPWLTEATVTFESSQTGYFNFTYWLDNSPHYMDAIPLKIISANVHKEMNIYYDNGYVPGDLLQANDIVGCWGDAPNGIIFAKRGDALHPLVTEDLFLHNSEGLYEGDITLTATEADQYCKNKLGPTWYAPNKAQLADIQRHVLELGTSYRLNNTPNAYYWSYEGESNSNFWAINFEKGLVEPAAVSTPATTQCYVRCITNL